MKLLAILSTFLAIVSAALQAQADGSLSVQSTYPTLSFSYQTPSANDQNWIGIWPAKHSSLDLQQNGASIVWGWARKARGVLELPNDKLDAGDYKAYFFKDGGSSWAAIPITFHLRKDFSGNIDITSTSPLTLKYTTTKPNDKNWIGLYHVSGGGPESEEQVQDALTWKYSPDAQGSIVLDTTGLADSNYKAYFLSDDQYNWLAAPVELSLGTGSTGYPGTFNLDYKKAELTFNYSTTEPNDKNWIGIYYAFGGGPTHEALGDASLAWVYAPGRNGTALVNATALDRNRPYKAFYLSNDGYRWVGPPVPFGLPRPNEQFEFIVEKMTTHNARHGEKWEMDFSQLLNHAGDPRTKFGVVDNDEGWIQWDYKVGRLYGTPDRKQKNMTITVQAESYSGILAFLELNVPVVPAGKPMVEQLRVLSMNLWDGGRMIKDFHQKQVSFIANSNVDVVGLQESTGQHGARIANALGWNHWQGNDVSIISRYPFAEVYPIAARSGSVRIALDGDKTQVIFWDTYLGNDSYGPHDFCYNNMSVDKVMQREMKSERPSQMKEIMSRMKDQLENADNIPVLIVGDFNSPSHLDWTDNNKHCGVGHVPWPSTKYPVDAGMLDSYRVAHPDPVSDPGITWSPIHLDNNGRPESMDRIDFVFYKGKRLSVLSSEAMIVDKPKAEPKHWKNLWPSDHKAVLTIFKLDAK